MPLQSLLEHTLSRICLTLNLNFKKNLTLYVKYGFDGTNAHRYKQKCGEISSSTDYLFCSSLVPLRLVDKIKNEIYWLNPNPSSTRFCRPIKIMYKKETNQLILNEGADLKKQIKNLKDIKIGNCSIQFEMMLTMIDGKVN